MTIPWKRPTPDDIDIHKMYLVWTNGYEHTDQHVHREFGFVLLRQLQPNIVRGRPLWIAEITIPENEPVDACGHPIMKVRAR